MNQKANRRACSFCKKRKLGCNRELPCGSCQKFGFRCQYAVETNDRVLKINKTNSRVAQLEARLGDVEKLVKSARQQDRQNDLDPYYAVCTRRHADIEDLADLDDNTARLLEQSYFDFVHPVINLIHQGRYVESRDTAPSYLRHAIWTLGALKSEVYSPWSERLYQSSRKRLDEAELTDRRFDRITLAQAQTVLLIAAYELHHGYFHVAWMSIARAVRLVQLLKLHRLDGVSQSRDSTLKTTNTAKGSSEAEEMRRAFWHSFLMDRYCSVSTRSPPLIQERNIYTYLPVSDDSFAHGIEEESVLLSDALGSTVSKPLSSLAALVVLLCQSVSRLQDLDLHGMAVGRGSGDSVHENTNILHTTLTTAYRVPEHLNFSISQLNPGLVYLHAANSSATIILHLSARARIQGDFVSPNTWALSNKQCVEAAENIVEVMKTTQFWDPRAYHFLTLYSIYSAIAAFASFWLAEPQLPYETSIRFLLNILESFKPDIRLAHILLQDIETEFPSLQPRLNAQNSSVPQRLLLADSESLNTIDNTTDPQFADSQSSGLFFTDDPNTSLEEGDFYTDSLRSDLEMEDSLSWLL